MKSGKRDGEPRIWCMLVRFSHYGSRCIRFEPRVFVVEGCVVTEVEASSRVDRQFTETFSGMTQRKVLTRSQCGSEVGLECQFVPHAESHSLEPHLFCVFLLHHFCFPFPLIQRNCGCGFKFVGTAQLAFGQESWGGRGECCSTHLPRGRRSGHHKLDGAGSRAAEGFEVVVGGSGV